MDVYGMPWGRVSVLPISIHTCKRFFAIWFHILQQEFASRFGQGKILLGCPIWSENTPGMPHGFFLNLLDLFEPGQGIFLGGARTKIQ